MENESRRASIRTQVFRWLKDYTVDKERERRDKQATSEAPFNVDTYASLPEQDRPHNKWARVACLFIEGDARDILDRIYDNSGQGTTSTF